MVNEKKKRRRKILLRFLCCYSLNLLVEVTLQQALESLAVAGLVQ